jgi:MFS family permease
VKLFTDLTPLREIPAFRRLWAGTMLSSIGGAMTNFAVTLQVYDMTHSTAAVGGLGVAALVPMLIIALPGGTLADKFDRRTLMLVMTAGQTGVSALLFTQAFGGLRWLWLMYALEAVSNAITAVNQPVRRTIIAKLVPAEQRAAALALSRVTFQVMLIAGSALAGVVAAGWSPRCCPGR